MPLLNLTGTIRTALSQRKVVLIPDFSPKQSVLLELAGTLGTTLAAPIIGLNRSTVPNGPWYHSVHPEYQRIVGLVPTISLDYCVRPSGMIRWFTDLTEIFPRYRGIEQFPSLIRTTSDGLPYAAVTDRLTMVEGATTERVADLIAQMKNLYGFGTSEIYLDRPGDLLIHISDGIAVGRMPGPVPQQGQWLHLTVEPG